MAAGRSLSSPVIRKPSLFRSSPQRRKGAAKLPAFVLIPSRVFVVVLVVWSEYGTFYASTSSCMFDDSPSVSSRVWDPSASSSPASTSSTDRPASTTQPIGAWRSDSSWSKDRPYHVLIVSDPQILDMRSYPGRPWIAKYLGIKFTDAYIRKAWKFVRNAKGPHGRLDSVIWLGDLLDSGVETVDRLEHAKYSLRFFKNFPSPSRSSHDMTAVPNIRVPGNHDVGLHLSSAALSTYGRERFRETFGPSQGQVEWSGWDVVWVDSMALLEESKEGDEARQWVENLSNDKSTRPRILLTHIPLFRPEGTFCGSSRESKNALRQGKGKNYQNELDEQTTAWLVNALRPTLVYSGDDHDSCIIKHPYKIPGSEVPLVETTVKAFSMAMGVKKPGYHLLSLYPPKSSSPASATYTQTNCTLPDQISIWLQGYLLVFLVIIAALFLPKLYRISASSVRRATSSARSNGLPVHRHRKTLSRQLLGGRDEYSDENDDQDSLFPTFPFSQSGQSDEYAYHSGLDSEDLPTASHTRRPSIVDEEDEIADPGSRVRRVSRVYMWEHRNFFGDNAPPSPSSSPMPNRLLSRSNSQAQVGRFEESLSKLGPIHRFMIRPILRLARKIFKKVWIFPSFGRQIENALLSTKLGEAIVHTTSQVTSIIWPGVVLWVAFWVRFSR